MILQDYDFGVNLSQIADDSGFKPMPNGDYDVKAESVKLKSIKHGDGKYLAFEFVVIHGPYKNRKIFQNVIVEHNNEDAKRIGLQWLKSWLIACNGNESDNLKLSLLYRYLNHPCIANVVEEEGRDGYSAKNKIQRFKKASEIPF